MQRYRVGIAHLFEPGNSSVIDGLRIALGGFGVGRIPPHITLIPPSNIHPRDVADEIYRLRGLASRMMPFSVVVGPVGTFHPVSPVVFLRVDGELDFMSSLQENIASSQIYRRAQRAFVPHVTLVDGADEQDIINARKLLRWPLFEQEIVSFAMLESKAHGFWEVTSDFKFEPARKLSRGGLNLEVFSHSSGDLVIYDLAPKWGVDPGSFRPSHDARFRRGHQKNRVVSLYCGGQLLAVGSSCFSGETGFVRCVVVEPSARGIGLGTLVLEELIYLLRTQGVELLYSLVPSGQEDFVHGAGAQARPMDREMFNYDKGMTLNSWSFSSR